MPSEGVGGGGGEQRDRDICKNVEKKLHEIGSAANGFSEATKDAGLPHWSCRPGRWTVRLGRWTGWGGGEVGRLGRWTGRQATWGTQWPAARVVRAGKPVGRARFFSYCCLPVAAAAAAFPTHSKSV